MAVSGISMGFIYFIYKYRRQKKGNINLFSSKEENNINSKSKNDNYSKLSSENHDNTFVNTKFKCGSDYFSEMSPQLSFKGHSSIISERATMAPYVYNEECNDPCIQLTDGESMMNMDNFETNSAKIDNPDLLTDSARNFFRHSIPGRNTFTAAEFVKLV